MSLTEILPIVQSLSRREKFRLVQRLLEERPGEQGPQPVPLEAGQASTRA